MKVKNRHEAGFTLLEGLIVIGIMMVLTGMAVIGSLRLHANLSRQRRVGHSQQPVARGTSDLHQPTALGTDYD